MSSDQTQVIIIGGGQAGLTAGYYLRQAQIPFLILDAAPRAGHAWRERWDSLELFTPARYSALPGTPFPGDPWRYPSRDEIAAYLETYAREHEPPIKHNTRVTSLTRTNDNYALASESATLTAPHVIVATGAYQTPDTPPIAAGLSDQVTQLHSAAYRNPEQIPDGTALVVGSANSGCQIAHELATTHRVYLSRGQRLPNLPHRLLGRPIHWWGDKLGLIAAPLDSLKGRTQRGDLIVGPGPRRLARRDRIQLRGRTVTAHDRTVTFDAGEPVEIDAVIWATGYRSDYSWIHAPVLDERGKPRHHRGVTDIPGLYFLGMHNQYSRGSSLIHWVREDAAYLVDLIRHQHHD
jgi:putative flavoprotein involved in K+ transport